MPVINKPLTNQELLTELQKRIKEGTITYQINSEVQASNHLAKLFNISFDRENSAPEKSTSSPSGLFNNDTWLGIALIGLLVLLFLKKSYNLKTEVDLIDKSLSPMNNN